MFRLVLTFILFSSLHVFSKELNILIDAGHGGQDLGALTTLNNQRIAESELAFLFAQQMQLKSKEKYAGRLNILLTRENKSFLSLNNRVKISNSNSLPVDLFLSLHFNSAFSKKISGAEVFFQNINKSSQTKTTTDSNLSVIMSDLENLGRVKKSLNWAYKIGSHWPLENIKMRSASFYILENVQAPSLLLELGYLTNPNELKQLVSSQTQNLIIDSILKSLANPDYFE